MTGGSEGGDTAHGKCLVCSKVDTHDVYACPGCVNRLTRALRELEAYLEYLPHAIQPVRGTTGRMSPGYRSTPPMRLEVTAAMDRDSLSDEEAEVRSLTGGVAAIRLMIAEAREEEPGEWISYIRSTLQWCATQPWVDDLADDVFDLHRIARRLAKDDPQKPLGDCLNVACGGKVRWGGPGRPARCGECKRSYDGLDLVRLGVNEETAA